MNLPPHVNKEDLLFDEVLHPSIRWCKSGHPIPDNVKVYKVRGPALNKSFWGNYCELCVAGAHNLAKRTKESSVPTEIPQESPPTLSLNMLKAQLFRAGFVGGLNEREEQSTQEPWELFLEEVG